MRLLWKHLIRRILRAPYQPILILLTVAIAVASVVTAFRMGDVFAEHGKKNASRNVALGDLTVSVRGDSRLRMMLEDDVRPLLGEGDKVCGEYATTVFWSQSGVMRSTPAAAVDFVSADRYFDFQYRELGVFTQTNLDRSIIITDRFAETAGLSMGDEITLTVFGVEIPYTVRAIAAKSGILEQRDVLLPISGVREILADWIPAFAVLSEDILPCNRLMIRLSDPARALDVQAMLQGSGLYADKAVELTYNPIQRDFIAYTETAMIYVMAFLVITLGVILIATCLYLMQKQRSADYAQFYAVGVSRAILTRLQMGEAVLYAVLGAASGTLLASPLVDAAAHAFDWFEGEITLRPSDILLGVLVATVPILLCTLFFLRTENRRTMAEWNRMDEERAAAKDSPLPLLFSSAVLIVFGVISYFVPIRYRFFFGCVATFACAFVVLFVTPYVIRLCANALGRLTERGRSAGLFTVVMKNIRNHTSLCHVARLFAVLVAVLIVVVTCDVTLEQQKEKMEHTLTAEFVAVNASETLEGKIDRLEYVDGCARVSYYESIQVGDGFTVIGLSILGDAEACVSADMLPSHLPTGHETMLAVGVAALLDVGVQDEVVISVQGNTYTLTVSEIIPSNMSIIYFNAEEIGMPTDGHLCISIAEGYTREEVEAELTAILEADSAVLLRADELFGSLPKTFSGFLFLLRGCVVVTSAMALIGCVNVLYAHHHVRGGERSLLRMMGMTRRQLRLMHTVELLTVLFIAAAVATLFGAVLCNLLDHIARSFGIALFV